MNKSMVLLFAAALALGGCATPEQWAATGGSRSDGVVKLSYQYGLFQKPIVSAEQGVDLATSKCAAWGYTGAQPFGGATRRCNDFNSSGCDSWTVTAAYQCLGNPNK